MEYLRGQRDPGEALRLIDVLPEESATAAMMRADPARPVRRAKSAPGQRWREHYGWTRAHDIGASTFDLLAAANAGKKKKPITYPRPRSG